MSLMLDCRPQSGYSVILQKDELLLLHILEEGDGGGTGARKNKETHKYTEDTLFLFFVL